MVKLKLYGLDASAPVRAVKLTLAALELPYEYVLVNILKKEQYSKDYLEKNPQHTVPTLQDGDDFIADSHAIIAYLVSKYGKDDSLYPKDLLKRAVVDQRLHFESGVVFNGAIRPITVLVLFKGIKEVPKERIAAVIEVYDLMETFLKAHDYIAGDHLTIADFSLIATITTMVAYLDIDPSKYPKLSAWIDRLKELPYYSENAIGAQQSVDIIKNTNFHIEE